MPAAATNSSTKREVAQRPIDVTERALQLHRVASTDRDGEHPGVDSRGRAADGPEGLLLLAGRDRPVVGGDGQGGGVRDHDGAVGRDDLEGHERAQPAALQRPGDFGQARDLGAEVAPFDDDGLAAQLAVDLADERPADTEVGRAGGQGDRHADRGRGDGNQPGPEAHPVGHRSGRFAVGEVEGSVITGRAAMMTTGRATEGAEAASKAAGAARLVGGVAVVGGVDVSHFAALAIRTLRPERCGPAGTRRRPRSCASGSRCTPPGSWSWPRSHSPRPGRI